MPVQGDMIFTLGTNPVAQAMGKAAEPRRVQVLRSHPRAGQENNSFAAPHPGHLASAGAAVLDILTCTWKAEKHVPPSACPLPAIILHHPPPPLWLTSWSRVPPKFVFRGLLGPPRCPTGLSIVAWRCPIRADINDFTTWLHETRAAALNPSIEVKSTGYPRGQKEIYPESWYAKF